jgi:hypothetical protein
VAFFKFSVSLKTLIKDSRFPAIAGNVGITHTLYVAHSVRNTKYMARVTDFDHEIFIPTRDFL